MRKAQVDARGRWGRSGEELFAAAADAAAVDAADADADAVNADA